MSVCGAQHSEQVTARTPPPPPANALSYPSGQATGEWQVETASVRVLTLQGRSSPTSWSWGGLHPHLPAESQVPRNSGPKLTGLTQYLVLLRPGKCFLVRKRPGLSPVRERTARRTCQTLPGTKGHVQAARHARCTTPLSRREEKGLSCSATITCQSRTGSLSEALLQAHDKTVSAVTTYPELQHQSVCYGSGKHGTRCLKIYFNHVFKKNNTLLYKRKGKRYVFHIRKSLQQRQRTS